MQALTKMLRPDFSLIVKTSKTFTAVDELRKPQTIGKATKVKMLSSNVNVDEYTEDV